MIQPDAGLVSAPVIRPPWALLAEVTHACPLHCPYCSNPLKLIRGSAELGTADWVRVLREAGDLGIVQTHISGGEPLLRPDLAEVVAAADRAGLYTQLVTSGVGLTRDRLAELTTAGLRSVQLSVQDATAAYSDHIAGRTTSFAAKHEAARVIRDADLPFGLNVVLHRLNLDHLDEILQLAVDWGADRVELANIQFYGWGLRNRGALMPSADQLAAARSTVAAWQERPGVPELIWVLPDYADGVAKPCMGGWGTTSITVAPDGTALPCPAAYGIDDLAPPNLRDHSLRWIWTESAAFARFRGTAWMPEPCRSCPAKELDFGGCRCQAYALTGDAARTDPACRLSPDHHLTQLDPSPSTSDATPASPEPLIYRRPT